MAKRNINERVNTITPAEFLREIRTAEAAERDIIRLTSELAEARGIKAGAFRRVKNAGGDVDAMRQALALQKMDDGDRNRLLENVHQYSAWMGVQLWVAPTNEKPQGALWTEEAVKEQEGLRAARATNDGYNSRRNGADVGANPYTPGSIEHQSWANGWADANRDLDGKKAAPTKAPTAKRPVGRPKKGEAEAAPPGAPIN